MSVCWLNDNYLKRARNSLIMCRYRKPFEVKKRWKYIFALYGLFPDYFHWCFVCFILGWFSTAENAEMKIKRLLSKHLAPSSDKVSGFGVLICFVVNMGNRRWMFWLLVISKNLLHEWGEGGRGCELVNVHNGFLLLWGYLCSCNLTSYNQSHLILHSCPSGTCGLLLGFRIQWNNSGDTSLFISLMLLLPRAHQVPKRSLMSMGKHRKSRGPWRSHSDLYAVPKFIADLVFLSQSSMHSHIFFQCIHL